MSDWIKNQMSVKLNTRDLELVKEGFKDIPNEVNTLGKLVVYLAGKPVNPDLVNQVNLLENQKVNLENQVVNLQENLGKLEEVNQTLVNQQTTSNDAGLLELETKVNQLEAEKVNLQVNLGKLEAVNQTLVNLQTSSKHAGLPDLENKVNPRSKPVEMVRKGFFMVEKK